MPRTLHRVGVTLLALCILLVVASLHVLALISLVCQGLLQHTNMLVQLVIQLLRAPNLALLLCDLSLHFRALNIPCVPSSLVVVPFDLQKAHNTCVAVSYGSLL